MQNDTITTAFVDLDDPEEQGMITNVRKQIALYGYIFLFIFGYFGNIITIIIFLQKTLRSISTNSLFICISISNIIYLLVCIYDFLYAGLGLTPIDSDIYYELASALCRFRTFLQSFAMCSSAWLLVAISIDRWIRIRYPFRVKQLCTIKRSLLGVLVIIICAITFNSHHLLPTFGILVETLNCGATLGTLHFTFKRKVISYLY